jgi:pyruvate kinase
LEEGADLVLTTEAVIGEPGRVPVQYEDLPNVVNPGERILLDDGLIELRITETNEHEIHTKVVVGGVLHDKKGMNLPDGSPDIPALTEKDMEDIRFALEHQVDWIALSFVRTANEVLELKSLIQHQSAFGRTTPVIAKIEKPEAIENIDAIIEAADAIMIARGDLGIETSPETVPMVQKSVIAKCHRAAKPVVTATQMLDSMIRNPRPTRAEAADVANAVLDGSDAIMLSGETAAGSFPIETVRTMVRIAEETERVMAENPLRYKLDEPNVFTLSGAICHAAMRTAEEVNAKAIVAPTVSGATAKLITAFRPKVPLIAVTPSPMVQRQLCLYWGIHALLTRRLSNTDEVVTDAIEVARRSGFVGEGDTVVLTAGVVGSVRTATNLMMVRSIEHVLARGIGLGQREVAGRLRRLEPRNGTEKREAGPQDILFANTIDRSCIRLLQRAGGVITQEGDLDSPAAMAAVELGIPAIIGIAGDFDKLVDGAKVIMDTTSGQVMRWHK